MGTVSGDYLVARALQEENVDTVFYLMGAPVTNTAWEIDKLGIRTILVRHEEGAARMAHAYARVTAGAGVVMTSSGPGAANMIGAIANAYADAAPVVAIGGRTAMRQWGRDAFQEMDQLAMFKPITKWAALAPIPEHIPEYISTAFRQALTGRYGPAYVDLPGDVLSAKVEEDHVEYPHDYRPTGRPLGDPDLVRRGIEMLARAEKPLVITGSGILWSGASQELREFIDATGIPFYTTPQGRGVVPEDHDRCFPGARSLAFREADVVLVVGARPNVMLSFLHAPRFRADAKFIAVNIDPTELGHNVATPVGIQGDAKAVLRQLIEEARGKFQPAKETPWVTTLAQRDAERREKQAVFMDSNQTPIHPLRVCREVADFITRDTYLVVDGHETLNFARQSIPTYEPGHRLNSGPHGNMGVGVPAGIGAQIARPNDPVVILTGDGAFGWNGIEMDTAIRYNLPLVVVVNNNGGYTSMQTGGRNMPAQRELGFTRYDKMVEALGGFGDFVEKPDDIKPALERARERAFAAKKPALVNIIADPAAQATTDTGFGGGYE